MNQAESEASDLLRIRRLSKTYPGGFRALKTVDFTVRAGEIHALLGENGAGKSTLIKTITGITLRDDGEVWLDGREIHPRNGEEAQAAGIATVYQEVALLPNLSVAQNLFLGRQPTRFGLVREGEMGRRSRQLLQGFGLDIDVSAPLGEFSVAVQHIVAIARAVDLSAKVLILDEPTASLDAREVEVLFTVMRQLKSQGMGIVFVTHFLDQVHAICDRLTVLRNGGLVGERTVAGLPRMELVRMMLGRDLEAVETARSRSHRDTVVDRGAVPAVQAVGLGKHGAVAPFDMILREGEVLGLSGLLGSGRTETARLIFGVDRADQGELRVDGTSVRLLGPRDALRLGFGFCPEERKTEGIVAELSVRENIILALQARAGWLRPLSRKRQDEVADRFIKLLDIRPDDPDKPIGLLSGGNQQKAVLARWLATGPRVLILDEPTRGIDVGAHAEIIRLIRKLCDEGLALLVISSEVEEIVSYADRVTVLRDRHHVAELTGDEVTEQRVLTSIAAT
ncbi:MAG: sugar ABC transporter ATP-binding protein [Rhodospirillum sp.]|nr:sugar ABC transporter ATP-binding protein [Rhodospirillum sp.]MCF8491023.1 sugar ABC transporter ATP-binding protein [Rhodospirillum sp.]